MYILTFLGGQKCLLSLLKYLKSFFFSWLFSSVFKLLKKIRNELGGDSDGEQDEIVIKEKPSTMVNALQTLQTNALQLFDEIKKSTRYSVSVISIQTSNALLRIVKFIRFGK